MGPSSPGRGLDCRGAPGHGGAPAGTPQRRGGVSPRPACLGERDLFVKGVLQVLSDILRSTVGAGDVGAGDVGGHAREGLLKRQLIRINQGTVRLPDGCGFEIRE